MSTWGTSEQLKVSLMWVSIDESAIWTDNNGEDGKSARRKIKIPKRNTVIHLTWWKQYQGLDLLCQDGPQPLIEQWILKEQDSCLNWISREQQDNDLKNTSGSTRKRGINVIFQWKNCGRIWGEGLRNCSVQEWAKIPWTSWTRADPERTGPHTIQSPLIHLDVQTSPHIYRMTSAESKLKIFPPLLHEWNDLSSPTGWWICYRTCEHVLSRNQWDLSCLQFREAVIILDCE